MTYVFLLILSLSVAAAEVPTGQASPEGAACDLALAFINADKAIWNRVVMTSDKAEYRDFLADIASKMDDQAKLDPAKRSGPMAVGICFKMGKLSKDGPNSYALAVFALAEIGFVDVGVVNHDHTRSVTRTFVCKKGDQWFVLPRPDLFPLLTSGLNDERRPDEVVYGGK